MEDRYEIRGKIGQGGIGTVYRGYDTKMNREVAIKRILQSPDDPSLREEATKQLTVEAGALASLQHPHIVTVYDVGADEDGPYVVMELISGKTLDEIIEGAPLTWQDFREMAMQSHEALIAAQELDMIHSDLKPPNIMLTWLPSGKFQVKIVDFGLAVLAQNQSKEELESMEAVFGSIFFMPPEQFEREPLDARSDLYSMGCCFYQALTGSYPFSGETGTEVMEAHLNHTVIPLQDVRADIPLWVCEWVMWHLNRRREDRPQTAREALANFLQNDREPNPEMSRGSGSGKRPRLIIPGQIPSEPSSPEAPAITGVPLMPPDPSTSVQPLPLAPAAANSQTSPQALSPPDGSRPSVHTAPVEPKPEVKTQRHIGMTSATTSQVYISPVTNPMVTDKTKVNNTLKVVVAVVLGFMVVLIGWMLVNRSSENQRNEIYSNLVGQAAKTGATEVLMDREQLQILLDAAAGTGANEQREVIYRALSMGRATDGTDIDAVITEFATGREMLKDVQETLIGEVLRIRSNPAIVPRLLEFARNTGNVGAAVASYRAVRNLVHEDHAEEFLSVILQSKEPAIRRAAENNLGEVISSSESRLFLTKRIISTYLNTRDTELRHAMIRLLGQCGTERALDEIRDALGSSQEDQIAAIVALGEWADDKAFGTLIDYIDKTKDVKLRSKAFDSIIRLASRDFISGKDHAKAKNHWSRVVEQAKLRSEKERVIRALVNFEGDWAADLVRPYTTDESTQISDLARKGLEYIKERQQLAN